MECHARLEEMKTKSQMHHLQRKPWTVLVSPSLCPNLSLYSDSLLLYRPLIYNSEPSVVVKRPTNKPRKSSALRTSLGPSALSTDDDDSSSSLIAPRRKDLSRLAIQRNAEVKGHGEIPFRAGRDEEDVRPSYSKDYLQELRQSTPSTPKGLSSAPSDLSDEPTQSLDLASKFGTNLSRYTTTSAIPTDAEIREKKERRARLAKEQEFISLNDDEDDGQALSDDDENITHDPRTGHLILKPTDTPKYPETRLTHDDEDIFEDFDDFTAPDGKISLGRKAEREAAAARKAEMAALIANAENDDDDEDDDSEEGERNAAFEVAQTRHGTYASRAADEDTQEAARPRTPPRIAPLPVLDGVVEKLRARLLDMQRVRAGKMAEMQRLVGEKKGIADEEVRVQKALKETAGKYAKLRVEMGIGSAGDGKEMQVSNGDAGSSDELSSRVGLGGGLGLGAGAGHMGLGAQNLAAEEEHMGLGARAGLGMSGRGLDSLGGTPVTAGNSDYSD